MITSVLKRKLIEILGEPEVENLEDEELGIQWTWKGKYEDRIDVHFFQDFSRVGLSINISTEDILYDIDNWNFITTSAIVLKYAKIFKTLPDIPMDKREKFVEDLE